tara:strand:- start:204 stop:518 length:315 start_codon:yes stop_codon:yes gene_type:complete
MASLVSASEITITNRSDFENLVIDKKLERFLISLSVLNDGKIKGSAAGREVTGDWDWIDGFFCRNLLWGARELKYNCQLVTFDGKRLRFTSDRGKGQSASFALR